MKKLDFLIAFIVFVLGIVLFTTGKSYKSFRVSVYVDGKLYEQFYLNKSDNRVEDIETKYGNNTLKADKNGICIISSTCKDKLEVKQGYINRPGQCLVCLPNKLIVKIDEENGLEAVTY